MANAEIDTFKLALDRFCTALAYRIVHLDDDRDLESLEVIAQAIRHCIANLLECELAVEMALHR